MAASNLLLRVGTAAVLAPAVILACLWRRPEAVAALVFVAAVLATVELAALILADPVERWACVVLGAALAALAYLWGPGLLLAPVAAVVVAGLLVLARPGDIKTVFPRMSALGFGAIYGTLLPMTMALMARDFPRGGRWVLFTLTIAWFGDTAAYFGGKGIGGPKLYPAVSPKKTWAGAIAGLVGSALAAVLAVLVYLPELGWTRGVALAVVGGAVGQAGDLVESLVKRCAGVKDSGTLLPGHGGMLDRIDALLFIAPVVYFWVALG